MADFIFRVDSVQLSDHQQAKIASAIQGAVLTELARLDLHEDPAKGKVSGAAGGEPPSPSFLYRPIKWYGGLLLKAEAIATAAGTHLTAGNQGGDRSKTAA
jgi:hypothetical protein